MELQILGWRFYFTSCVNSITNVQGFLILSLICRESLLFTLAAASVSPDQDHTKFNYNQIEWPNGTDGPSTDVKCLVQKSNNLPNETLGGYRLTLSFGDGVYIFGFIGILIVLKYLLTKIMMVENKPEDSEYVMTMCEIPATYKITLEERTDNNNVPLTPPNSPCMGQPLSPAVTSTPVLYSDARCGPLSNLDGGGPHYGERCPFSSPVSSTKSLE